jgi:hypothetical protein
MLIYDDLARACRENDMIAEERGFESAVEAVGASLAGVLLVAEQRAIRAALYAAGKPVPTDMQPINIRPMTDAEFMRIQSAVLDGIAIGLRAALNRSTEDDLPKQP